MSGFKRFFQDQRHRNRNNLLNNRLVKEGRKKGKIVPGTQPGLEGMLKSKGILQAHSLQ